jgi:hypothetical protein
MICRFLEGEFRAISEVFCSDCVDVFGVGPLGVNLLLNDEDSKLGFVRCVPLNSTLFFCFHVGWIVARLWSVEPVQFW